MQVTAYEIFPTKVLQIDVSDIITEADRDALVFQIDELCKITTDPGPVDLNANPSIQSKTFLFDEGCPEVFEKLKESFLVCCRHYLEETGNGSVEYAHSRAWFFKTWKSLNQKNDFHNHFPAFLSGVFYLKGTDHDNASGTVFENPNYTNLQDRITAFEPKIGSWIIFPGSIYHKNDEINSEVPRYVIAADYFGYKV
jgi:hypothetical protein